MINPKDFAANMADKILRVRRARSKIFAAELFNEPAWDLLLELFVADAEGRRLTAAEIGDRAGIVPAVLSRWLIHLSNIGLVVGDGDGNLDDVLTLSQEGIVNMEWLMRQAESPPIGEDVGHQIGGR